MKKMLLMLFLLSTCLYSFAPNHNSLYIEISEPITIMDIYEPLIKSMYDIEADNNPLAYNKIEGAYGGLQIRKCRLDHYNRLTGKNYRLTDMYNFETSKEIFLYFATHSNNGKDISPKSFELAAKNWNGSGPMTENYWDKIKSKLL